MPKADRKPTTSPDEGAHPELVSWAAESRLAPEERIRRALHHITGGVDVLRLMAVANISCGEDIGGSAVELIGGLISDAAEEIEEALAIMERPARRVAT